MCSPNFWTAEKMTKEPRRYDVIIIGAGPAGLTAAIYSARAGLKTFVVDEDAAGGQVKTTHMVGNYPGFVEPISGYQLSKNMRDQAERYGAHLEMVTDVTGLCLDCEDKWVELEDDERVYSKFVIVATGRSPRKLLIPGEEELKGHGLSYCATCDGEFYAGKDVFVVGGGNSAIEESLLLLKHVNSITFIHQFDQFTATMKEEVEKILANPKVSVLWSHEPRSFALDGKSVVVEMENLKTRERHTFTRDGVFIFVGMIPNSDPFKDTGLEMNNYGYVPTDELMGTNLPGVYAVGDIRDKMTWQITTAVGEATVAALEVVKKS